MIAPSRFSEAHELARKSEVEKLGILPTVPTLSQICDFENMLLDGPNQIEFPVEHHFAPGVYTRSIFIPKGSIIVGKMHKTEHLNIVSQGLLTVWTEQGMKLVGAPAIIHSFPNCKRVALAHEDTVWTTVHANPDNETDVELLEARLTYSRKEQLDYMEDLCRLQQ